MVLSCFIPQARQSQRTEWDIEQKSCSWLSRCWLKTEYQLHTFIRNKIFQQSNCFKDTKTNKACLSRLIDLFTFLGWWCDMIQEQITPVGDCCKHNMMKTARYMHMHALSLISVWGYLFSFTVIYTDNRGHSNRKAPEWHLM